MKIETKLGTDAAGNTFWRAYVKHEGAVVFEVRSQTFDYKSQQQFFDMYERTCIRVVKELFKNTAEAKSIVRMLVQEDKPNE
jgi:hypothetical protein